MQSALAIQQRLAAAHPDEAEPKCGLATTYSNLALLYAQQPAQSAKAEAAYQKPLDTLSKLLENHWDVVLYQRDMARAHNNLATLYAAHNRPADAEREFRASRDIHARLADARPDVPEHQNDYAASLNNLAYILSDGGRADDAEAAYRTSIQIRQRLASRYPDIPDYRSNLALTTTTWEHS